MPIQAVTSQRLYQQVADQIADLINRGVFAVGDRLPPERDLSRQLTVSRPTVREALIALEIAGLVEVRTGSGAYVCRRGGTVSGDAQAGLADAGPSPFELVAARRLVEPGVAALAAQSATKRDLQLIAEALAAFERHWNGTHWEKLEADRQFHQSLAEATHNGVVIRIVEDLWRGMFGQIFAILSERTQLTNQQSMTMHDHRDIFACVQRGDAAGAQAAMTSHLVHVEQLLLEADGLRDAGRPEAAAARPAI